MLVIVIVLFLYEMLIKKYCYDIWVRSYKVVIYILCLNLGF